MNPGDPNLRSLELAADRMGAGLRESLVFVGGAVVGLLLTDPAAADVRPTDDVDTIVHAVSRIAYGQVERALRERGFDQHVAEGAPICRWRHGVGDDRVLLDVMPSRREILGFSNRWYEFAIQTATSVRLPSGLEIRVIAAPAFLATKLVAFEHRGQGDFRASHDLEDIVTLLDGRASLPDECHESQSELREWLATRVRELLDSASFREALSGHLSPDAASQDRRQVVVDALDRIARA